LGSSPGALSRSPARARKSPRKESEDSTTTAAGLLTVREVATMLRVDPSTVYGLCERGELTHGRVSNAIRIAAEDVRALVRSRRTDAPSSAATVQPEPEE
jgi:excisionase family DNA binding protein